VDRAKLLTVHVVVPVTMIISQQSSKIPSLQDHN
jgi:hypothetical protein